MFDLIISHYGCKDGTTASWLIWRRLPAKTRKELSKYGGLYLKPDGEPNKTIIHPNSVEGAVKIRETTDLPLFIFVQHGDYIDPKLYKDQRVAILDLNLGDQIIDIVNNAQSVLLIDHHDITLETINKNYDFLHNKENFHFIYDFSEKQCAASLLHRYLYPGEPLHPLVEIVRINDTSSYKDSPHLHPKAILCYLRTVRAFRSFPDLEEIYSQWAKNFHSFLVKGRTMAVYSHSLIKAVAKKCDVGYFLVDKKRYTVAYVQSSMLHSEIADSVRYYAEAKYKRKIDLVAVWKYNVGKGKISVSLRNPVEGINLSEIANYFNGGGSKNAAAFSFDGIENFHRYIHRFQQ
jgi:hypothetical protein